MTVPSSLRRWFVFHFFADLAFAVPLMLFPTATLLLLGWTEVDPVATRIAAAALVGIGTQSLLGRNEGLEAYRAMLSLKCIWSAAAIVGLGVSIAQGAPPMTWGLLATFVAFAVLWNTYRVRLGKASV